MKTDENVLKKLIHDWIIFKIYLYMFHQKSTLDCIFRI